MPFNPTSQADETLSTLSPRSTDLSSRGLKAWPARIKDAALFSARTTQESYLQMVRKHLMEVAAGTMTPQVAEAKLKQTLQNLGYKPEAGFPDNNGRVPPARRGSMTDLSSSRRIQLILDTNIKQARSLGQLAASEDPMTLMIDPAWHLTRTGARKKPRGDWKRRWAEAGRACGWRGALKNKFVALKTSPIWQKIAEGAGGFKDAIGTPYPPFAFGSGLAWVSVGREEWEKLCKRENAPTYLDDIDDKARELKQKAQSQKTPQISPVSALRGLPSILPHKERVGVKMPPTGLTQPKTLIHRPNRVSQMKPKAQQGITEAVMNISGIFHALTTRYIPTIDRLCLVFDKYGEVDSSKEQAAVDNIKTRLAEYKKKLQDYSSSVLRLSNTVRMARFRDGIDDFDAFEKRMGIFLAASGRYEDYALKLSPLIKAAYEEVKTIVQRFKVKAWWKQRQKKK